MAYLRKIDHHRQQHHSAQQLNLSRSNLFLSRPPLPFSTTTGPCRVLYLQCIRLRTTARDLAEYRVLTHLREMGRYGAAVKR